MHLTLNEHDDDEKLGLSQMPEVGFEPTFPDLRMAQQRIPEVKQICVKLILLTL